MNDTAHNDDPRGQHPVADQGKAPDNLETWLV
jgi:hypothetical protein